MSARAYLLMAASLFVAACDQSSPSSSTTPAVPAASITGPGVVKGKIIFNGPAPEVKMLLNKPCCDGAPDQVPDESVIVNPNGTLANAVVYLEGNLRADGKDLPPVVLDQKYCRYTPHVIGVVAGQTLRVTSSDPVPHNVNYSTAAGERNRMTKPGAQSFDETFIASEFIRAKCDIHPWMSGYICVMKTPLFYITGTTGEYEIANVPVGNYKLIVWHERYGKLEQPITIADATPVNADLTYAPPTK